jgi:hypothetical protein
VSITWLSLPVNCAPAAWLQRTTFGFLVVDDDCSPHVELLADLHDFGGEGDGMFAVVSPLAGYKRFNDPVQGFGAEHVLWTSKITTPASHDMTEQVIQLVEVGVQSAQQAGFL